MKTKNYDDLSQVPLDKLYKLRDVANDNYLEHVQELLEARCRLDDILSEIQKRYSQKT